MDTSSNSFSFTTTLLGDGSGSSTLYDVAIISDSLAYAVGSIYQSGSVYNLAKWNGQTWQLLQIKFLTFCGQNSTYSYPTSAIWAFSENTIWISSGSQIVQWNGQTQTSPVCIPVSVNKLWGENSNSIYAVGYGGGIVHYNGTSWTKIESGTTLPINDIYGAYNSTSKQWEILAVVGNAGSGNDRKILRITWTSASSMSDAPIAWPLNGVWFVPSQHYYVVGSGIYEKRNLSDNAWLNNPLDITSYYTVTIRGNAINDVFAVGAFGDCLHWNGVRWKSYRDVTGLASGSYGGLAMTNNIIMTTGYNGSSAVVTMGRRN